MGFDREGTFQRKQEFRRQTVLRPQESRWAGGGEFQRSGKSPSHGRIGKDAARSVLCQGFTQNGKPRQALLHYVPFWFERGGGGQLYREEEKWAGLLGTLSSIR